ncbi:hypothetical protein, partial [Burkholderia glumae]|uniref:hypothetical protein n=1 Tax=Burkholderia glumae TaxID=337 RepID=UPI0005BBDDDF
MKLLMMVWVEEALEILLREPEPPGPAAGAPVRAPASAGVALFWLSVIMMAGRAGATRSGRAPARGPGR